MEEDKLTVTVLSQSTDNPAATYNKVNTTAKV
jgi:hypothetical protein